METKFKSFDIKSDGDSGQISGYFSTYDRIPDSYGDIVAPGAFTETIKAREESGHPFPLCWNHDLDQIIGTVDKIEDTEKGPLMTASFFDTPLAQEKRALVLSGCVFQFSFAYAVKDWGWVTLEDGTEVSELRKLDLFEVSIVPIPANQNAVMTEIKSGKRNSKKDADALKEAINLIQKVLGEFDEDDTDEVEDEQKSNVAAEETEASNTKKAQILEFIKSMKNKEEDHES